MSRIRQCPQEYVFNFYVAIKKTKEFGFSYNHAMYSFKALPEFILDAEMVVICFDFIVEIAKEISDV